IRASALTALGDARIARAQVEDVRAAVRARLDEDDPVVVRSALATLAVIGSREDTPALLSLLPRETVSLAALTTLVALDPEAARAPLAARLEEESPEREAYLALALEKPDAFRAILLERLARDSDVARVAD